MQNNFQKTQIARNLEERSLMVLVIGEMQIKLQWDSRLAKHGNGQYQRLDRIWHKKLEITNVHSS